MYVNKALRKKMGLNTLNYARKEFDKKVITNKFEKILKKAKLN